MDHAGSAEWNDGSLAQSTLDAIPDPVFVKDLRHRWIAFNEAFCKLVGKSREWILGKSDPDLFPPDQVKVFWQNDDTLFESGRANENEELIEHADGTSHTIWTRKFPMRDGEGRVVGLCGVITDVTNLRARQEEVDRLEREVADKTRLIEEQENQLRSAAVPVIQVWRDILLLPLIGMMDDRRANAILETILTAVARARARFVLLDLTGLPMVDTEIAGYLVRAVQATNLLGCRTVVVGISPGLAQTIVGLGIDFNTIVTRATLHAGLEYALEHID